MPFRHAHWAVLLLFPIILFAFWPEYFGTLRSASFALHAHGVTASLWIALVALQSWAIATRRNALHRSAGLALFAAVPLFTAGGLLAMHSMAVKFVSGHPFYALFGPMLGIDDLIAVVAVSLLVRSALRERRRARLHGGYMLATVILVLPPVMARVFPALPGFPWIAPPGVHPFLIAFELGQSLAAAIALLIWARHPKQGTPFLLAAGTVLAQSLVAETFGRSAAWSAVFGALGQLPALPLAAAGMLASATLLWSAWRVVPPVPRRGLAA